MPTAILNERAVHRSGYPSRKLLDVLLHTRRENKKKAAAKVSVRIAKKEGNVKNCSK